jgi:hypothetical protein
MKTLKIKEETHRELTKVLGDVMAEKGERVTYDVAITRLIEFWRENHE